MPALGETAFGTVSGGAEVKVLVRGSHNVEWTSGAELDNRSDSDIAQHLADESAAGPSRLINAAEHKTVALVEVGVGPFRERLVVILR